MKKGLKWLITVVVLLAVVGGGIYYYLINTPKNKYLLSEKESVQLLQSYFSDRYENEMVFSNKMAEESYNGSVTLGVDIPEQFLMFLGISKEMVDSTNLKFNVAHDGEQKNSSLQFVPTVAGSEMGTFGWQADKDYQYIEAPILDNKLSVKNDEIIKGLERLTGEKINPEDGLTNETLNLNTALSAQLTADDMAEIRDRYISVFVDAVADKEFTKEKKSVEVFEQKEKLTAVSMHLKEEDVRDVLNAFLKELQDDQQIQELFDAGNTTEEASYKTMIEDLQKEVKEVKLPEITSTNYVDGQEVLKRAVTIKSTADDSVANIEMDQQVDEDLKVNVTAKISSDGQESILKIEGSSVGEAQVKDNYVLTVDDGYEPLKVTLKNTEKREDTKLTNDATVVFDFGMSEPFELGVKQTMNSDVKNNEQTSQTNISYDMDGSKIGVNIDTETKLKSEVKIDKAGAVNINELSDEELTTLKQRIDENLESVMGLLESNIGF